MADDSSHQQPLSFSTAHATDDQPPQLEATVEDAETRATRQELKHTAISETNQNSFTAPTHPQHVSYEPTEDDAAADMRLRSGKKTPELQTSEALSREETAGERKVSSPKKKRAHDEVEPSKDIDGHRTSTGTESSESGWVMVDNDAAKDENHRSEPQKKRARDETSPPADIHRAPPTASTSDAPAPDSKSNEAQKPETSASAFASSGFSKLASSTASPFATAGAKKSVFGGGASNSPSPFAGFGSPSKVPTAQPTLPNPTLSFGSKDGAAPSPFAAMNGSTPSAFGGGGSFGGGFGGGSPFARTLGGSKPGNFATPGIAPAIKSDKPAKPFGAPASDAEDDSDSSSDSEGEEAGGSGNNGDDAASREESASAPAAGDEERRTRFRKVAIDDGEAHEATIIQARGRMYYLGKSTDGDGKEQLGWRERGAGILKINVPAESVKIDAESGTALASSFDPSVLEKSTPEKPKLVRLLMRQDSTLRVILNCAMIPGMDFQLKEGLKSHSILFTAIEGADASHVQVQMKMSQQSAESFLKSIDSLKKRIKGETS